MSVTSARQRIRLARSAEPFRDCRLPLGPSLIRANRPRIYVDAGQRSQGADMKPAIQETHFGSITVGGETFDHDIVIRLSGKVKKRKKKLSKQQYGSSHTVSLAEAEHIFDDGAELVIVGTGQHGILKLSDEAKGFFRDHGCKVQTVSMPDAVKAWNEAEGKTIGMFHVTC